MKKIIWIVLLVIVIAAAIGLVLTMGGSGSPDYVFLITLDTQRADHVDYSLENNTLTPNLAKLAAEGIRYDNAFASIPITLPSHASMFYSMAPHQLKVYNNQQKCDIPHQSIAELMKQKGYDTGAVISLGVLEEEFGLDNGFGRYVENFKKGVWIKHAEEVNRDVFEMLKDQPPERGFYWVHYSDPHGPYFEPAYLGGEFSLGANGTRLFQCDPVEQKTVKVTFPVEPGKNILNLKTKFSKKLKETKQVEISIISYMNFKVEPAELFEGGTCDIQFPEDWHRYTTYDNMVCYNSQNRRTRLYITNNTGKKTDVTLSFFYKIVETTESGRHLYKEEVRYMDRHIGKLIAFLKEKGMYDRSAFVIMGDHGEGLGEHRELTGHVHYLNRLYTHVPFILAGKGFETLKKKEGGGVRQEMVSNLNIAPTILELAGIPKPEAMVGQSLLGPLDQEPMLLETYAPEAYHSGFSLLKFPYQVIYYPTREKEKIEFYDLTSDTLGINNVSHKKEYSRMKAELLNAVIKLGNVLGKMKKQGGPISDKHKEILRSLGYL